MSFMRVRNQMPTKIVEGDRCRLGFVGEAPAEKEVQLGRPFVGWAGNELDVWLRAASVVRPTCYIGNLSQERAPGDKIEKMFVDSACTIPNDRLKGWIEELRKELEIVRPNCVVALGAHPLYILTGKKGITKYWGSILPSILVPGLKVIPIAHPSWIIRGFHAMRLVMITFLRRAVNESAFPDIILSEREYLLDPPFEMVMHHLLRLMSVDAFAFDIERPKVEPGRETCITHISFSDSPNWAMSIPFVRGRQLRWHESQHMEILRAISALMSTKALKIAHNLMFDFLNITNEWKIPIAPPYWDTMVAHNRCYPDLSDKRLKKLKTNSLAFCTALYTKEPFYKDDFKAMNEDNPTWRGTEQEFQLYNAKDSAVAYEIHEATKRDLTAFKTLELFTERDMRVFQPLAFMGLKGVLRDQELLKSVTSTASAIIQNVELKITTEVGHELNIGSPQQVSKVLYNDRGHRIQYHKKTNKPTTDEAALRRLARISKDPLVPLILKHRRFNKFFDYLETIIPADGRTRCSYNQARTTTFRISSSKSAIDQSGGNLQNIPSYPRPDESDYNILIKELKKTYIADPGMVMARRDYKQGEAVVVAYLAEDEDFIAKFNNGEDMHSHNYSYISSVFGKEEAYEHVLSEVANGNPEYKIKRNLGKKAAHATNYKMGKRTLKDELAKAGIFLEEKTCESIIRAFESARPKIVLWWKEVEEKLRRERVVTNCFGRRRFFMGLISEDTIREAIAFEPQSTIGDLLNFSIVDVWDSLATELDLLLQIHDALVWQSPEQKMRYHSAKIGELMSIPMTIKGRTFTIPTDLSIGPSWGELVEVD